MVYFFVHTPKTSGTTFMEVLRSDSNNKVGYYYPPRPEIDDMGKWVETGLLLNLRDKPDWEKYNFIGGHFTYGVHRIFKSDEFMYLGVIREPINHFISAYRNFVRTNNDYMNTLMPGIQKPERLSELTLLNNMQTFFLSGLTHEEIQKDKERAYQTVIENVEKYFVGVYPTERFDDGLIYFQHKIGIKPMPYKPKNVATNKMEDEINDALLDRIREITDVDRRLFDYFTKKFDSEFSHIPFAKLKVKSFQLKNKLNSLLGA